MKRTRNPRKGEGGPGWAVSTAAVDAGHGTDTEAAHQGPPLARLRMEKRRGKPVTVAELTGMETAALRTLGKVLKAGCGTGGTVKGGALELQGDHRETLRAVLPLHGVRVKG